MQYTNAIALALAAGAAASPIVTRDDGSSPFGVISIHSGNVDVHLRQVNANHEAFYLGKDTSSFCPDNIQQEGHCPQPGNLTQFVAYAPTKTLFLNANVPGGQQVYINSAGALAYTPPHSGSIPEGSSTDGFTYTAGQDHIVGRLSGPNGETFAACPVADENNVYQVFDTTAKDFAQTDCIGIALGTSPATTSPGAWQYD